MKKRFIGTFIDAPQPNKLRILHNYDLLVTEEGFIGSFGPHVPVPDDSDTEVIRIPNGSFLLPSFCDLHLHAPQFLYQGTGLHLPLMEWLDEYAFKAEERIDADPDLARRTYQLLAKRLKEHGTGTVLLFGTIKVETNLILAEVMQTAGIRAFVGKLSMDISSRKTYVEASTDDAVAAANSFVKHLRQSVAHLPPSQRLVEPVLTPRFVPTCSDDLLEYLSEISEVDEVRVQSHLAEARDQVDWVQKERGIPDIDVFDKQNLLTRRTIQVHCTYLGSSELKRLAARRTGIAHCPLSNAYFSDRPFPLAEALYHGVHVGLGTDIAGGYSIDMMNAMRSAVVVSRMRDGQRREFLDVEVVDSEYTISWKEALYLATRGGAETLRLSKGSGAFKVGAPFDAQLICLCDDSGAGIGALDFFDPINPDQPVTEEMLEKWWCIGDTRNRFGLWIQGQQCYP